MVKSSPYERKPTERFFRSEFKRKHISILRFFVISSIAAIASN